MLVALDKAHLDNIYFELDTKWATYLANCAATEHGLEKKIGRKWKVENNEKED
jgi:hypothetical protein